MKIYTILFYLDIYKKNLFLIFIYFIYDIHFTRFCIHFYAMVKIECQAHIQIWGLGSNFGGGFTFHHTSPR